MFSDKFKDDWYGWATNQCGHFVIGLALATPWPALWWAVALGYLVCVEVFWQKLRLWRDGVTDALFVCLGAAYVVAPIIALLVGAVALAIGVWRRQ